ncbi:hypothetical protein BGX31_000438 [Mortierella sp. GBA43]|nr:hypothetical protein BGX31_000438 [Mortierella sp. GBA43]
MFWDKDRFTKDDFMGVVTIPFNETSLWSDGTPMHFDDMENKAIEVKFGFIDTTLLASSESSRGYCKNLWSTLLLGRSEFGDDLGHVRRSEENTTVQIADIPLAVDRIEPSAYNEVHHDTGSAQPAAGLRGVVFMEVVSAANLPEMPNALRTGFDMDPFVIIAFGGAVFRTRVIRHDSNPVWKAKIMFRVYHGEDSYDIKFSIHDWDKMSGNDKVGTVIMPVSELIRIGEAQDDDLEALAASTNGIQSGDPYMKDYIRPIQISDTVTVPADNAQLRFLAKFVPYKALRRRFWYGLAKANGNDDLQGLYRKVLIQNMLEGLGSNIGNDTIDGFFKNFKKDPEQDGLTFEELFESLEQRIKLCEGHGSKSPEKTSFKNMFRRSSRAQEDDLPEMTISSDHEQIIRISTCPICRDPSLGRKPEIDVITHVAICSGNDGFNFDKLVMNDFETDSRRFGTEENANRKWINKFLKTLTYGRYVIGENNANIIIQERGSGIRIEEKMQTSIRLGIRLLYQGSANKIVARKILANMSIRQGLKFDDPRSKREIEPFIRFHQLQEHMAKEVKEPELGFKNFNQFFYRELREGARELSAPGNDRVAVSVADCRMSCFQTISDATKLWIKGQTFTLGKLLKDDELAKKFEGGGLVIFRLAPQDYHRQVQLLVYKKDNPSDDVYGENKRVVSTIETKEFGTVAYVAIGAMMVGSILLTTDKEGQRVERMQEHGYFAFGGSTIVVLFEPNSIQFDEDLLETSKEKIEMLVKVGMSIGTSIRT